MWFLGATAACLLLAAACAYAYSISGLVEYMTRNLAKIPGHVGEVLISIAETGPWSFRWPGACTPAACKGLPVGKSLAS